MQKVENMGYNFRFSCALLLLFVTCHVCFPQTVITGTLLNDEGKTPISFANIGILNTPVGTISNTDGTFEISIPAEYLGDSILFAALGFERRSIAISLLAREDNVIYLKEQLTVLKNVTVRTKKLKPVRAVDAGNQFHQVGSFFVDSVAGGAAMALLIENPRARNTEITLPYFVTAARLRIAYNSLDFFRVRVRFLAVDSGTGEPGHDLFNESVVVTSKMRKGWLNFDLSKYTVRIPNLSFYIVFEWILEDDERLELIGQYKEFRRQFPKKVRTDTTSVGGESVVFTRWEGYRAGTSFGTSLPGIATSGRCYYRNNSLGKWKRSSYVLAATVTIANYE